MVELLVALAIGAAVVTTGVMIFQNLTSGAKPSGSYTRVTLGSAVMLNFYGLNQESLDVWLAPNYGRRMEADQVRNQFMEDLAKASAVFCLGRGAGILNDQRPVTIPVGLAFDGRSMGLPDDFRLLLESSLPASAGIFSAYRGASNAPNATVFLLQPSGGADELFVLAIYEIDVVETSSPVGTYASVRRYVGDAMTHFYDVFFSGESSVSFTPPVVAFERVVRGAISEGASVDRLKVAAGRPFYFLWWPDPAMPALVSQPVPTYPESDPRASYATMNGQTGLFFVIPMFPAL